MIDSVRRQRATQARERAASPGEINRSDTLEIGRLVFRIHQAFHQMTTQRTTEALKVTATQGHVLNLLGRLGPSNAAEISRRCCVDPKSITHIVERLVRDGFLMRRRNAKDRRVFDLLLTASGRNVAPLAPAIAAETHREFFSCLNSDEVLILEKMLRRIADRHAEQHQT